MKVLRLIFLVCVCLLLGACRKDQSEPFWIYTSLYKDTIADLEPHLRKEFPGVPFRFYQAGSEEIAARVNTEIIAGGVRADLLISSDRFWYEELASEERLIPLDAKVLAPVRAEFRRPDHLYSAVSLPIMVLVVNEKSLKGRPVPQSFSDLLKPEYGKFITTGSPLASGTHFTTLAFLQKKFGPRYFSTLQSQGALSEGGNSAVFRRVLNGERPIGLVLLENLLRFQDQDIGLKMIIPAEGAVIQNNVLAILKKKKAQEDLAQRVAAWFFSKTGQAAMLRSFMHSPLIGSEPPRGAPRLEDLQKADFVWEPNFVRSTMQGREQLKESLAEALFGP